MCQTVFQNMSKTEKEEILPLSATTNYSYLITYTHWFDSIFVYSDDDRLIKVRKRETTSLLKSLDIYDNDDRPILEKIKHEKQGETTRL